MHANRVLQIIFRPVIARLDVRNVRDLFFAIEALHAALDIPVPAAAIAAVVYVSIGASVFAFVFRNRGVNVVGANAAGFTPCICFPPAVPCSRSFFPASPSVYSMRSELRRSLPAWC